MNKQNRQEHAASTADSRDVWARPFVRDNKKWCDDFVIELRLAEVPGGVIGDRLAEVETHCAESGESAQEAFGDPLAYARTLAAEAPKQSAAGEWRAAVAGVGQVLALLVGTRAAGVWAAGEQLQYNLVQVTCLVLAAAVLAMLPLVLRPLVHRPVLAGVPYAALFLALALGGAIGERLDLPPLITVPPAVVTIVMFVVLLVLSWVSYRTVRDSPDFLSSPLVTPNLGEAPAATTGDAQGRDAQAQKDGRVLAAVLAGILPVFYVVLCVISWFFFGG